jgi:predicted metal-dependent phosphotriesterase family hydrolase
MIETARRPVAADDLGRVPMHEHIFVLTAELQDVVPYLSEHGVTDDEIDAMLIRNRPASCTARRRWHGAIR